jgi:hypothetical protein
LCTACVATCGNQKTLSPHMALTCGNTQNAMWMKNSFGEHSSTAFRFPLGIPAGTEGRSDGKYTAVVM